MTSDTGPTVASPRISGHVGGRKGPGPYPHIDDLLQVTPEGNTSQPLGHLLGIAENGVKYAKFQADLGRIDIALKEYIKAYVVAVTVIPTHRDYTSLQGDRKNLGDRYSRLTKTLHDYADNYESIKQTIKDDNARTGDYFGPNTPAGPTSAPATEKRRTPLPDGDIITVEELVRYQRIGSKDFRILVIDVRSRPEFEEGHILSSATICIEPDILQRDRIEAADVEDAMELGPPMEKRHFERRHEFDMVVFYDHDSEHLSSGSTNAPASLFRLLTDFDYPEGDPGSKHPKLLKGGLEAWQDAMGGSALQKSSKTNHKKRPSAYDWLRVRSPSKPIQSIEEARRWEEKLTQLRSDEAENGSGDEFQPVSTLQALFASGGFGEELMSGEWAQLYKVPKKSDENIEPPQLLTKILANLLYWMGNGKFSSMQAKTLMEYLRQKSSRNSQGKRVHESQVLGTNRQQDAMEFFGYVFTELDDETNRFRNRPSEVPQPEPSKTKSLTDLAIQYWDLHSRISDSIIDKYWRITEVVIVRCDHCGHVVTKYSNKDMQFLSLPQSSVPVMMEDLLQRDYSNEHLDDYTCDNCSSKGHCWKGTKLARLPDYLCVCFTRFEKHDESARFSKITTTVDFPIRELDLTPYAIQGQQAYSSLLTNGHPGARSVTSPTSTIPTDDHHFNKPFRYEAYAVVQHGGELNSGHYIGAIRDEPHGPDGNSKWHVADDAKISEITVGPSRTDKGSQFLYRQSQNYPMGMQAFMVFYQRKDAELV
ncbi:putative ubiquitin carboxyl-terminal hydrolase [Diaporthe ampelina]|uniref:Putative ubiquitin carboxyl-terminal hydrolase n=1 Tax=Diaporthe ampelina TaxID=1214573 RepID=A0A0G2F6X6_9PEZI|nr:putative ubiquitin carboxyl-terminal hydrolase [Diaporthe ampelina]